MQNQDSCMHCICMYLNIRTSINWRKFSVAQISIYFSTPARSSSFAENPITFSMSPTAIIAINHPHGTMEITTTDMHLAKGIGEAVHHAYQGELKTKHTPGENLVRVHWHR